jgi:cell division control protein 45
MLLQKDNWRLGYHQIISDCRASITHSTGGTVLILVNPDADALCAGRILSYALRADKVPYQLRPCGGFNCLLKILEKLALNGDEMEGSSSTIRAVVLLNLGATRNLQKTLFEPSVGYGENNEEIVSPPLLDMEQTKLYVLDSHRPYHLANIYAQKNIVLWNDENFWHTDEGGIPSDGEYLDDESDESESEDEDDSDDDSDGSDSKGSDSESEAEFDDVNGNGKLKKDDGDLSDASVDLEGGKRASAGTPKSERRKKARTDPDTPDIRDTDDENDKDNASIVEKEMADKPIISMREKHKLRRDKVRKYYSNGSFHSSPVAFMAYILLAEQLRHDSIGDLLWLACVGVSDAFVHHRLDLTGYAKLVVDLQEKIEKIYPDLRDDDRTTERMVNTAFAEDLYEKENYNGPTTEVGFSENGKILYQREEFRFFLLRHTSLWDAMILSPDLNTKMELWRSSGIKKLQEMLAKMGLPLAQCQQPYAFMKPSLKRRLKLMMNEHEEVSVCFLQRVCLMRP